jgi:hypothetical protein
VRRFVAIVGLLLCLVGKHVPAAECPPGVRGAVEAYRQALQAEQHRIRDSGAEEPRGVEETVQFDVPSHACHRGPGQAYREFGAPACEPGSPGQASVVRYPFALFFRKALTLEALYAKDWEEGSDGAFEVVFEKEGDRWVPVSRREVLPGTREGAGGESPREP